MAVLIAPARVRFRDPVSGAWLVGVSEPKIDPNHFRVQLDVKAYAPCPRQKRDTRHFLAALRRTAQQRQPALPAHLCDVCGATRELVGERTGLCNLLTNVYAKLVQAGLLGTTTSITDTGGTARSVTNALNGGMNSAQTKLAAGTGVTAATVADTNLQTPQETISNPTVNAVSGSGSSGTFTVVGTITATADRSYTESGIIVQTTTNAWNFLVAHDSFSALAVSSSGTLALTYQISNA